MNAGNLCHYRLSWCAMEKYWKKTANLPLDEDTTEVFVATGRGCMEGCPKLVVCRIYIGFVLQQESAHVQAVVDAALKEDQAKASIGYIRMLVPNTSYS